MYGKYEHSIDSVANSDCDTAVFSWYTSNHSIVVCVWLIVKIYTNHSGAEVHVWLIMDIYTNYSVLEVCEW